MLPVSATRLRLGTLLGADATTFSPAALKNLLILFQNNIAINDATLMANLTEATFDGYAAISLPLGGATVGIDPLTGQQFLDVIPGLAGNIFTCTGGAAEPQTVYGYAIVNSTKTILLAAQNFTPPVTFTGAGQILDVGPLKIQIVPSPMY